MTEKSIVFEKDGYVCEATVIYTLPQGKWVADSDIDYLGGYEVLDMVVYQDDYAVDKHPITWEDVIREYEIAIETTIMEHQLPFDDDDMWIDDY